MIGDHLFDLRFEREFSFLQTFCQELSGMENLNFPCGYSFFSALNPWGHPVTIFSIL